MYKEIRPGKTWYDTDGERIQAHGGSVLAVGDTFYWYGENKKGITGYATGEYCGVWHHGVSLYSSKDLYNWKNEGVIMVDDENPDSPFYPKNIMDRPHIVYCERTGKFVLWAKCAGHGGFETAFFGVCESTDIRGPYTYVRSVSCEPYHVGDFDLVVEDGRGYAIFEHPHTKMIVMELNDTFNDVTGDASEHLQRPFPSRGGAVPPDFRDDGLFPEPLRGLPDHLFPWGMAGSRRPLRRRSEPRLFLCAVFVRVPSPDGAGSLHSARRPLADRPFCASAGHRALL